MIVRLLSCAITAGFIGWAGAGAAADFRSVTGNAAVLYDAPSAKSKKLYVVSQGYPFEVVVLVEGWSKVRDANGDLTWIESKQLSDRRTVLVNVPLALEGGLARISCSIGISVFPDDASEGEALIDCADKAMYAVKAERSRRYAFFPAG